MNWRWVVCRVLWCAVLPLSVACNSKPQPEEPPSVPSSLPQNKASQASSRSPSDTPKPASPAVDQSNINYAKNPERFIKQQPYEPPFNITNPRTAQEHFNAAVNHDHHQEFDKAIGEYQKALALQPGWAVAHYRLAEDYRTQGREDDAIAEWEQATKYNPQFYSAYDLLAGAYARQGKIKKAIASYSALLKYPPAEMPAHYQLGLWYAQIGDREQARAHLESYRNLAAKIQEETKSGRFQRALEELEKLKQQG